MSNIALELRVTQNALFAAVVYKDGSPVAQENADGTVTMTLAKPIVVKEKPALEESKAFAASRSAQTGTTMERIARRTQAVELSWRTLAEGDAVVLRADAVHEGREYLALDDAGRYAWLNADATGGTVVSASVHAELRAQALADRDRISASRRQASPAARVRAPF